MPRCIQKTNQQNQTYQSQAKSDTGISSEPDRCSYVARA
ncbi:unnamed protein product [Brassica oleracea]